MSTDRPRILVVEDDDELAQLLQEYLGAQGFELAREASGDAGAAAILDTRPDLVVLDLMLPDKNGLDVCREVRASYDGILLMLTASQSEADHVAGLELGADDFVTKPIEPRVLLARIRAQLRRRSTMRDDGPAPDTGLVEIGALKLDVAARDVRFDGEPILLTTMEFDVLLMLARSAGSVVHRDDLYGRFMGMPYDGIDRGMDVHVSRIRRKLTGVGFDARRLKSVRGVGYLLAMR